MPGNIPIKGDDVVWKRAVDAELTRLKEVINQLSKNQDNIQRRIK